MSDVSIKFENISKQYRLGKVSTRTMGHDLNRWWQTSVLGKEDPYLKIGSANDRTKKADSEYVWSLRDISFDVKQGDVVGIVGRNGAGKSTLLKILSKVTTPTTGIIKAKGRIASLLEVGTGFHPDLTGRENVFMNGAVLGMTKKEISKKFDEIVDFAGVERYIDTPTKRYSSGMTVRLGFAVAAFLEPEILVVDEVLAVGDSEFQKKAIGKMQEVSKGGERTVLFVSHNMQAVSTLTNRCVLLVNGSVVSYGETNTVIQQYLSMGTTETIYENHNTSPHKPTITKAYYKTSHEGNIQQHGEKMEVIVEIDNPFPLESAVFSYQIINSHNTPVVHVLVLDKEISFCKKKGKYILTSVLPNLRLYPDSYKLILHLSDDATKTKFETIEEVAPFEIKVFGQMREYYWKPNTAIYIEDNYWTIDEIAR